MSAEEQRQYDAAIDRSLAHVQKYFVEMRGKIVTREQQTMKSQVESFAHQAQDLRRTDPQAAKSLAERAELLVHELADTLR
jgi:hypothetical protein